MKYLILTGILLLTINVFSQDESELFFNTENDTISFDYVTYLKQIDSINSSFEYQYGRIDLGDDLATLVVPSGFKFLDAEQSNYVLTDLWGNPPSPTMGLLFPEDTDPLSENFTYCVEVSYSEDGYIEDDDAKELNYDDLLIEMQGDVLATNEERAELGYPTQELIGWASRPYYDEDSKKLYWAKEYKFEGTDINTLNYDIRVLGRKGYLNLNAIGDIDMLDKFNSDRTDILASIEFNNGNRYSDFNPDLDDVAAYGIGGLIAGKVLAKAGFFAIILKFWKFLAIGAVALVSTFRKRIFGTRKNSEA